MRRGRGNAVRMHVRSVGLWGVIALLVTAASWNRDAAGELRLQIRPASPNLVGPDPVEPAPVLIVANDRTELDGKAMTTVELGQMLRTLASNYKLLHPEGGFNGQLLVACAPETSSKRLVDPLKAALAAGYPNLVFLLIQPDPSDRAKDRISGARATIAKVAGAQTVRVRDHANCMSLATALVEHRNKKRTVFLDLGGATTEPRR